jgi:hypothetical protein
MITHVTPAALDADPNLLKISESAFSEKIGFFGKSAFWEKVLRAAAQIRPSNESHPMHGQGKSPR